MPYSRQLSSSNPGCILFLLDQSGSMSGGFAEQGGPSIPKAQGVADCVNRLIQELILRCQQGEAIRDRIHVGIITYGGSAQMPQAFRSLSELNAQPLREESRTKIVQVYDGSGGTTPQTIEVKFPIWCDPVASGGTPMCGALDLAAERLKAWADAHPSSFPPIVFNITDGEATDGDPSAGLGKVKTLGTDDGSALVFNLLLSNGHGASLHFPTDGNGVNAAPLRTLIEGASPLPEAMRQRAAQLYETPLPEGSRGVVLNGSILDVVKLLDIGSTPANG
ncbi:VWA domain-containing protein [Holophaga foetida]|uniref:vWA domain-containing protein n=1 Tax=Holophaga foetida TaxID=35839 RepID=UPI0002471C22|nr:VWA domain-containing protein [Holophaga foetida]